MSYEINSRKEHQVYFTCRREIELLKKEMKECGYSGEIVAIEPIEYKGEPRIRVVVTKGNSMYHWGSWNAMITRVRLQTTNRRYSTKQVIDALRDADVDTDTMDKVIKILYPDIWNDDETIDDWENEDWFKENKED